MRPILVLGASSALGHAFAVACAARDLALHVAPRGDIDDVTRSLDKELPWIVFDAGGAPGIDEAEANPSTCHARHVVDAELLAAACATRRIQLVLLSSDQVFDGHKTLPYREDDAPAPLAVFGRAKIEAERRVARSHAGALVIRTGALFGCPARRDFVGATWRLLEHGDLVRAVHDEIVSLTYAPDLVEACLDLAIDGERGVWHLANQGPASWHQLARAVARIAGHDPGRVVGIAAHGVHGRAPRPAYAALGSRRGVVLPELADALARHHRAHHVEGS